MTQNKLWFLCLLCLLPLLARAQQAVAAGDGYFTVVVFSDVHVDDTREGLSKAEFQYFVDDIIGMGKPGGKRLSFSKAPAGYLPVADLVLCLGDMDPDSQSATGSKNPYVAVTESFNKAGIPFLDMVGNHDLVPDYWTGNDPDFGMTASGASNNKVALSIVSDHLKQAQNHGVSDVTRFTDGTSNTQAQPYAFLFNGVRFYMGQTYWFQKPYTGTATNKITILGKEIPASMGSLKYYSPDGVISALDAYATQHAAEPSIWTQHYPFQQGSDCDRWWLDQNDVGKTILPTDNNTSAYPGTESYFTSAEAKAAAKLRKDALAAIIGKTRNPAHFTGHMHEYGEYNCGTFTDYTVASTGRHKGTAYIVLCQQGTGFVECKRVTFRTTAPTSDPAADYAKARTAAAALASSSSPAIVSVLSEYPADYAETWNAGHDTEQAIAVLNNAVAIAKAGDQATSLLANPDFRGGTSEKNSSGGGMYPAGWTFTRKLGGWNDCFVANGVFNMWAGTIDQAILTQRMNDLPDGIYQISAEFKNDIHDGKSAIGLFADETGTATGRSIDIGTGAEKNNDTFYPATACVEVKGHSMQVGIYSGKGYYQVRNLQVKMLPDTPGNRAQVANSAIYQDVCWNRNALEFDFTRHAKYAAAKGADFRPMIYQPNALVTALDEQVAGSNVIVDGHCSQLVVTDKAPFHTSVPFVATAATYIRDASQTQWGTLMLPFPVASDADVQFYTLQRVTAADDSGEMLFLPVDVLPANTPGVFLKRDPAVSLALTAATADVPATASPVLLPTPAEGWSLRGTFEPLELSAATLPGLYYISADKFWRATGTLTVAPFRACFQTTGSEVRAFRILADEADALSLLPAVPATHDIYTLGGQRIASPHALRPGLYIQNHKKYLVR